MNHILVNLFLVTFCFISSLFRIVSLGDDRLNREHPLAKASLSQRFTGWLVHTFTASGACIGLLAMLAIYQTNLTKALWLMGATILIDAVDGMFARRANVKVVVPEIDGVLLDNIVDFFNYTIVPGFFLLVTNLLPAGWSIIGVMGMTLASAYQFTQIDAKTEDHFFKGFPSYWNIVVFYLFFWQMNPIINLCILVGLSLLSFVPIKFVYPSRMEYLTRNGVLKLLMMIFTLVWGAATFGLLWLYPKSNDFLVSICLAYGAIYILISLYRTFFPLPTFELATDDC